MHGRQVKPTLLRNPSQRRPILSPWQTACRRGHQQTHIGRRDASELASARRRRFLLHGACGMECVQQLMQSGFVASLEQSLARRQILCSAESPCQVELDLDAKLTICLPPAARSTRVCEPYGELWQRLGAQIGSFNATDPLKPKNETRDGVDGYCASFDLDRLAGWLTALRSEDPFFARGSTASSPPVQHDRLKRVLERKDALSDHSWHGREIYSCGVVPPLLPKSAQRDEKALRKQRSQRRACNKRGNRAYNAELLNWLRDTDDSGALVTSTSTPHSKVAVPSQPIRSQLRSRSQRHRSCAVVGSGHTLRCGQSSGMGAEIDAQDAVFRANAQQYTIAPKLSKQHAATLRRMRIDTNDAGNRTTYRVNCLFANQWTDASETCIVSHAWLGQPWGLESFNSVRHVCCDFTRHQSSYNISHLRSMQRAGVRVLMLAGPRSGEDQIDTLLQGSGGNALLSALALCDQVRLYGMGLHSTDVHSDKVYMHA
jgi:hypothetical protein